MAVPTWMKYLAGFALIFLIFAVSVFLNRDAEFAGADATGAGAISEIAPDYEPWFQPLWSPKPETESMLFALQAAIGAGVIGYFIGRESATRKKRGK